MSVPRVTLDWMLSLLATGISAASALGLTAGGCAFAARWHTSRIFGTALIAPRRCGELALTFDDGPSPLFTPRLLDLLAARNVHATFFLLGEHAVAHPELVRRVAAEGHLVGTHSFSHIDLALASATRIRAEIDRGKQVVEEISGTPVRFFRPPYGSRRPAVFRIARSLGLTPVLWSAMTCDWREPDAAKIASRLGSKIDRLCRRGCSANIVLHDGSSADPTANRAPSIAAVDLILQRYAPTHTFVTLDAWA